MCLECETFIRTKMMEAWRNYRASKRVMIGWNTSSPSSVERLHRVHIRSIELLDEARQYSSVLTHLRYSA